MKNLIIFLCIFSLIASPVLALQEIAPPEWEEFCPYEFLNTTPSRY